MSLVSDPTAQASTTYQTAATHPSQGDRGTRRLAFSELLCEVTQGVEAS